MQPKQNNRKNKQKKEKKKQLQLEEIVNNKAIKYKQEDSLQVVKVKGVKKIIETDMLFVNSVNSICKATENVLGDIISNKENLISDEECEQIHHRANIHRKANMININSHLSKKKIKGKEALDKLFCHCGCERFKGQGYPVCHEMQELSYIGSGILLFFLLSKGLIVNTGIMLAIYGIYALIMYAQGTKYLQQRACLAISESNYQLRTHYSSFNAVDLNSTIFMLDWLGLAAMMLWIFVSRLVKCFGFHVNEKIDENLKSSSDFAVKLDGLPQGEFNQIEIFQYFEQLYQKNIKEMNPDEAIGMIVKQHLPQDKRQESQQSINQSKPVKMQEQEPSNIIFNVLTKKIDDVLDLENNENHFQITSIQIIYKMEFSRKIIGKITYGCRKIKSLMEQDQEKRVIIRDKDAYLKSKKDIIETYQTLQDLRKKFLSDSEFRRKITTTTALVEFKSEDQQELVVKKLGHQSLTFYKRVKETFAQMTSGSSMLMFKGTIPTITRAPEPSDIQWVNCQKSYSYLRILGIFFVTFIIICISFGIITGLQAIQFALRDCSTTIVSSSAALLQILTSIVLVVINAILWVLLKFMLNYEYNHTQTNKITSLMNKAFLATWVNIIIIPIIVNYVIYDEYYGSIGIAGFIFDYQMIALAVSLPLLLLNPVEILPVIAIKVRCIRNYFIRLLYRKRDKDNLQIQDDLMKKVYPFYQAPEFLIEEAYTFIFPNIMHGLFYCQLQPLILIFVFAQAFLFYWFCKVKVLKMCKIPVMTEKLIFEVAIYQVMLGPLFYGAGSFFNSYASNQINDPQTDLHFIGAAICFGIGGLNYLNPGNIFQRLVESIADCFPCLRVKNIYKDLNQKKEEENERIQNYYRNSNSLSLIGFEKQLFKEVKSRDLQEELIQFCKSHVGHIQEDTKNNEDSQISDNDKMNNFLLIEPKNEGNVALFG